MIANDRELQSTLDRITWFQQQIWRTPAGPKRSSQLPRSGLWFPDGDRPHAT